MDEITRTLDSAKEKENIATVWIEAKIENLDVTTESDGIANVLNNFTVRVGGKMYENGVCETKGKRGFT